jgi:hypothetical protein
MMRVQRLVRRLRSGAAIFSTDRRGGVAVIFGLALVPLAGLMGAALDYSRAANAKTTAQSAVDSAVIAASVLSLNDDFREDEARRVFLGALPHQVADKVLSSSFKLSHDKTTVEGIVEMKMPTVFGGFLNSSDVPLTIKARSQIAKPQVRQLDIVMCIDGTGSMQPTINAVKLNATNFESNLNTELQNRGITPFDAMRVRAIFFRDYGGNNWFNPGTGGWAFTETGFRWISNTDPDRFKYVGDLPPMKRSNFMDLPSARTTFSIFVQGENAWGGGDEPESGLECVNEGIDSPWAKVGDVVSGKPLTGVYPVIVVWTDANAHPPAHPLSMQNPDYPHPTQMPRNWTQMRARWDDAARIDQNNKMLVFFGNPAKSNDSNINAWLTVRHWPGFVQGGTLTEGNTQMVSRIADAIASKIKMPTLTH